jgi:hypothetical protein
MQLSNNWKTLKPTLTSGRVHKKSLLKPKPITNKTETNNILPSSTEKQTNREKIGKYIAIDCGNNVFNCRNGWCWRKWINLNSC